MNLEEWYKALTRYASERGTTGLPAQDDISSLWVAGHSAEDSYDLLYPREPVTIEQQVSVASEVPLSAPEQAVALARSIEIPRVTEEDVLRKVVSRTFTTLPGGRAVVCEITMENGHLAHGDSKLSTDSMDSLQAARTNALTNAIKAVWSYEVYLMRETLYREALAKRAEDSIGISVDG
jgi:hypothetical protein